MEKTENELLPCPFCGGKALEQPKPVTGYPRVMCADCLGRQSASTIEEAVAAWNRREPWLRDGIAVTDEMVRRARDAWKACEGNHSEAMRAALTAAFK